MRCGKARQLLTEKVEGSLDSKEERLLAEHLESCRDCVELREQLLLTWNVLEAYPRVEPSSDFLANFQRKLHASDEDTRQTGLIWWPRVGWQWMAVVMCTILLSTFLTLTWSPDPTSATYNGLSREDRWDDKFLLDMEQSLNHWEASYLPEFDSWPTSLLDPSFQEAPPSP